MKPLENEKEIKGLLKSHGLQKTAIRIEMLSLFGDRSYALSAADIMAKMVTDHDRVTIYRALNSFEKHGIIHKASESSQGVKYALCSSGCPNETHADMHAHFVCDECRQTYCLDDIKIPDLDIPKDFTVNKVSYRLDGVCRECKA